MFIREPFFAPGKPELTAFFIDQMENDRSRYDYTIRDYVQMVSIPAVWTTRRATNGFSLGVVEMYWVDMPAPNTFEEVMFHANQLKSPPGSGGRQTIRSTSHRAKLILADDKLWSEENRNILKNVALLSSVHESVKNNTELPEGLTGWFKLSRR